MLLVLNGCNLLLLGLLAVADSYHLNDVETETQCYKTKDNCKEQLLVSVGEALYISCYLVELGSLGELASGGYLSLVAVFVLWIILIRHLFSENHFLPTHIYDRLIVRLGFLLYILVQKGSPVGDKQAVRVVLGPRNSL